MSVNGTIRNMPQQRHFFLLSTLIISLQQMLNTCPDGQIQPHEILNFAKS